MAQPSPGTNFGTLKQCYFTLENERLGTIYTCGDPIRASIHLNPRPGETLSISNLRVNFKCKVRTLITTGSGNSRRVHKSSVYLFWFSTGILGPRSIAVNAHQSFDVAFQFPWAPMAHPTQAAFRPSPWYPHQVNHRLPPTWSREVGGHQQTVQYYLESVMTRHGRVINHEDKDIMSLHFVPPLDIPDPPPTPQAGMQASILRTSRLLDPAKRDEPYGFRERTKSLFSSNEDPTAMFTVTASAPTVCCVGDVLPVTLHFQYDHNRSTAPEQPEVKLKSIHVRINDYARYRVPTSSIWGASGLQRDSDRKVEVTKRAVNPSCVVYDGMSLNNIVHLQLQRGLGPSFATFSINRSYMLKISAVFGCAGKDSDLIILRHPLTVHPPRALYRPIPTVVLDPAQPLQSLTSEEPLPLYIASPAEGSAGPPSYEEGSSKQPRSPAQNSGKGAA